MEVAGANRRWRWPFRCRGSRRESAVAQLSTLGHMTTKLKSRLVIFAFVVGVLLFISAESLLCYCPDSYILPAILFVVSACFGSRWIRIFSIGLFAMCIVSGIQDYRAEKHIEAIFRAVDEKQRAATNSITK